MLIFNKILLFRKLILAWLIFGLYLLLTFSPFNVHAEQQDRMIRPVSPFTLTFTPSLYNGFNISCNGGADGVIDMTINGGTPPFVISWSNGDTLEDIDSLFAGTYVVMVTDSDGTSFTDSVTLIAPDAIGISGTVINDSCFGGTNGAIDITVTNGAGGFSYSWSNLEITEDIINLTANIYTVTVTDVNSCTDTASFLVSEPPLLDISSSIVDSVSCFGFNDGAIDIIVNGGAPPYSYLWNDGDTLEDKTGLSPGVYTITVTDQHSCTTQQSFTIAQPLLLTVNISPSSATCGNNNGSAIANPSGGTGGITYLWSNTEVTQVINNLAPNAYTVTVTDINGCTATSSANITNIPGPVISSIISNDLICFGDSSGSIVVNINGGTPAFTFLWNDGATSQNRTNIPAGNYTITITDQNSCTATGSTSVLQPPQLISGILKVDATCNNNNGTATVNHVGGTGGITYLWSNTETTQTISNLAANSYTVTVTDANGCSSVSQTTIINTGNPSITSSVIDSVNCFGGSDGGINITVSGGTPTYTFLWNDGNTNEDRTGLPIGTYTVTVTDQNNCTTIQSFTIKQPIQLTSGINKVDATCGNSNGSATASHNGGTGGVTYLWNTSAVTQTITNLPPNTYTVTVTDINNCIAASSIVILNINGPSISSFIVDSVNCFGGSDGAINITVSSGTPTFTFLWNDGNTNEDRTGLNAGTYTITVTDQNSCTALQTIVVGQPLQLSVNISKNDATCNLNNGNATANQVGGTGGVTYLWSNTAITQAITNLAANTYTVTITDINSCTASSSTTLVNTGSPAIVAFVVDSVNCFGGSDGSINVTISGGTPAYSFLWNDGNTNEDRAGLNANTYTVTVTDQNNCTTAQSFIISQPAQLTVSMSKTDATCGNSNGTATASPSGGTGGITYLWNTSAVSPVITNLPASTYTVTVTDIYSCSATNFVNVNNANGPVITAVVIDSVVCFGQSNGNINITVSGGAPAYSFLWNDGNTNEDRTSITAGTYTVTVTDQNSCTISQTYIVYQPLLLTVSITKNNATCGINNGSETANAFGGTGGVTYLWSNLAVSQTIINLAANTYTVTVTDRHNCTATNSEAIINTGSPSITSAVIDSVNCFGGSDGSINITVSGGTPTYTFLWNDGNASEDRTGLPVGTYTVTVTDQNSCTTLQSYTVRQPLLLNVNITSSNATCGNNNGTATAIPSGGTGAITYLWNTSALSQNINGLAGNVYTVTVTDRNACTASKSVTILNFPSPVATLTSVKKVNCFGDATGAIDIAVTSGTLPYTYAWSNSQTTQDLTNISAGNYSVIVSDSIGCKDTVIAQVTQSAQIGFQETVNNAVCGGATGSIIVVITGGVPPYTYNWSNGQTSSSITNIFAGTYTLTVADSLGCIRSIPIGVGNIDGPQVSLSSHAMVSCYAGSNGNIIINVTGGTNPYQFLWSNGNTLQNNTNIPAGIYQLTVTDINGCIGVFTDTITQPAPISATAILNDATCFLPNGSIIVTPSGGTPLYTYLWSNGVMSSTNAFIYADTIYNLTIYDANSCSFDTSFSVSNSGTPVISLVLKNNVSCFGLADGSIDIDVTGGLPPYSYLWAGQLQVTQDLINIPVGGYDVLVVDTTGCSSTAHFDITGPTDIMITFPQLNNTNCGQSNGSIVASVSGGIPAYTYLWSNGDVTDSIFNLDAGSYTLTVTDNNGCTKTSIANISDIDGPVITSVDSILVTCPGGSNGSIIVFSSGGIAPLSYSWTNNSSNGPSISNLPANIYTITIADAANCIVVRSINITDPPDIVISTNLPQNNPPYNLTCYHSADGSIDIGVSGGTQPYLYIWSTGSNNEDQFNITAGQYTVIIKDSNNCEFTDTFNLTEPPQITAYAGADITICGQSYYTLNADSPVYGNGHWESLNGNGLVNFTDSTLFATYVDSLQPDNNIFSWTVTDGKCSAYDEVIVTVRSEITAFAGSNKPDLCGDGYTLTGTIQQTGTDIMYYWSVLDGGGMLDDSSKANTVVTGLSLGQNLLAWTYINGGCTDVDSLYVNRLDSIDCLSLIEMPSAFSPNGDGHNDYFIIKGVEDYLKNKLTVFDRWGEEVYSKQGYLNDWKGDNENSNNLPDGTYFYLFIVDGSDKVYKGFVDIRR